MLKTSIVMHGGQRRSGRVVRVLIARYFPLILVLGLAQLSLAQQNGEDFRAFITRMRSVPAANAGKAVEDIRTYIKANDLPIPQLVTLYSFEVQLQSNRLKDPPAALATIDEALNRLGNIPETTALVIEKTRLLNTLNRGPEALLAIQSVWPRVLESGSPATALPPYLDALDGTGQSTQSVNIAREAFTASIGRDREVLRIFPMFADRLNRAGKYSETMAWCKLAFIVYPYEDYALQDLTNLMLRTMKANGQSSAEMRQFLESLQTPGAVSAFRSIKLPPYDLSDLQRRLPGADPDEKVGILLALGRQREALLQARRVMLENPASPRALLNICRVAKAVTLNLGAANDFLTAYGSGRTVGAMQAVLRVIENPDTPRQTVKAP